MSRTLRRRLSLNRCKTAAAAGGLVLLAATGSALAVWDLASSVGFQEAWAENTAFTAQPGNGDAITSLRASGSAHQITPNTRTDVDFTESAIFFRDRSSLNHLVHQGRAQSTWQLSPNGSFSLNDQLEYAPIQGLSPESFTSALSYTSYGQRRSNAAGASYRLITGPTTTVALDARDYFQRFSDPSYVDSSSFSTGGSWEKTLSRRSGLDMGVAYAWNRFSRPFCVSDPNEPTCSEFDRFRTSSEVATVYFGGRHAFTPSLAFVGRVGTSLIFPEIVTQAAQGTQPPEVGRGPNQRGYNGSANLNWKGARLAAAGGYQRGLSTSSGVFTLSENQIFYGNLSWALSRNLTATSALNRTSTYRTGSTRNLGVTSLSAIGTLSYRLRGDLSASATFRRYVQRSGRHGAPDFATNTFSIGVTAAFD